MASDVAVFSAAEDIDAEVGSASSAPTVAPEG
jgi:hypothetical protein